MAGVDVLAEVPGIGRVESWVEVQDVSLPVVTFVTTFVVGPSRATRTSRSTLRFRELDELITSVEAAGFVVDEVRDAPDRPGLEHVVVARRPSEIE